MVRIRRPRPSDGEAVWQLARRAEPARPEVLGRVMPALIQHVADLSLVAEADGRVIGFVGGYRPGIHPRTLVVWQIDVDPALGRQGLGTALLHALIRCPGCDGVEHVEVTTSVSNLGAARLFERFAREIDATCESIPLSWPTLAEPTSKHRETLLRIGPIHVERAANLKGTHETL